MVHFLTTRLDVKLSTYMFEKVLNLPMDYFERTPDRSCRARHARDFQDPYLSGRPVVRHHPRFHDVDLFLPVMFFFSPIMTFMVLGFAG